MLDACREMSREGGRPHILNDNPMFDVASAVAYLETTLEMLEQLEAEGVGRLFLHVVQRQGPGRAYPGAAADRAGLSVHCVTATSEFHVPSRTAAIANETAARSATTWTSRRTTSSTSTTSSARLRGAFRGGDRSRSTCSRAGRRHPRPHLHRQGRGRVIAHSARAALVADDVIVFVHTGGTPANFTWSDLWIGEERQGGAKPISRIVGSVVREDEKWSSVILGARRRRSRGSLGSASAPLPAGAAGTVLFGQARRPDARFRVRRLHRLPGRLRGGLCIYYRLSTSTRT